MSELHLVLTTNKMTTLALTRFCWACSCWCCSIHYQLYIDLGLQYVDWQNLINKSSIIQNFCTPLGFISCSMPPGHNLKWSWKVLTVQPLSKLEPKPLKFLLPLPPVPTVCLCVHSLVEVYVSSVSVPPSPFTIKQSQEHVSHLHCRTVAATKIATIHHS